MKEILILGTGNQDIIKLLEAINHVENKYKILGFLDSNSNNFGKQILGYPILGGDEMLKNDFDDAQIILNFVVKNRLEYMKFIDNHYGKREYPTIVHPKVNVRQVNAGIGNVIYENVAIASNIIIGNFNIIYPQTSIAHEVTLGDNNLIAANVTIGARSSVGNNVTLGNSTTLNLGISICDDAFIGVGSVVINSLKESGTYFGYPARKIK